jgi:transposase
VESASKFVKDSGPRLPEVAPNGVTAGVDWAWADHAVAVVDGHGRQVDRASIAHTADGLAQLRGILNAHGVCEVAIERPDGPVVEALLDAGITVVVISPNQVKNLRGRYGSAGNKDDRFDAFVLADTLRTDRQRLRPLVRDSDATIALRTTCRARKSLVGARVAAGNQLREHLRTALPAVVGLFSDIDAVISLALLTRFDTQDKLDWLTPKRFANWLKGHHYTGRSDPAKLYHHISAAPRGLTGATGTAHAVITASHVAVLRTLKTEIATLDRAIGEQLANHADAHIFTSLPRSGRIRAARLLSEIGDCRAKLPTPDTLTCLAGAAPSTRQSGKHRTVTFRWSCDKQLRDAVTDFAADSRHDNPWAADLYNRAINRGHDHAHAVRILARAWLHIIWHCWQDHTPYNPANHRALQRVLNNQNTAAG